MKPKIGFLAILGFIALSIVSVQKVVESMPTSTPLAGTKWELKEVNGVAVQSPRAYLQFDEKTHRFSGNGGCNRVMGSYEVDGSTIKFSQAISTKMACIDPEVQRIETDFLKALTEVTHFQIEGNMLRLLARDQPILTLSGNTGARP